MQYENNDSKFTVVVNKKLPIPMLMNAVAHICYGMSHRSREAMESPTDRYMGQDESLHCVISRHPFIILQAKNSSQISRLRSECIEANIDFNDFVESMIASSSKEQLEQTREAAPEDHVYVALCMFGKAEVLDPLTKRFSLLR